MKPYFVYNNETVDIPKNVTHFKTDDTFNDILIIPDHITHLTFGGKYNQPINNLPPSITHLTFGW